MRRALVLAVLGLLLASSVAAAAPGRPTSSSDGDDDEDEGRRGHKGPAPIGSFAIQQSTKVVTGEHVSFTYGDAGIDDFRVGNRTLFDLRVHGEPDDEEDEGSGESRVQAEGAVFRVRTRNFTFTAHDNPIGVSKLETDGRATLTFEEGVVLFSRDEDMVRFSFGDARGAIRGDGLAVNGRTVTATEDLLVFLDTPRGSFDKHRGDIGQAIARGHVGAEATFNAIDDDVEEEVVSYGNVTMTTVKAERGNITLLVEGHGFDGRVLVLNVDGRVLGADHADKLTILLDNQTVQRASNLSDALDPDDDGFAPEAYLVYDPQVQAFQLMLTVPHYSVHTLSVTSLIELAKPAILVGVLLGTALLVPAAMVLFRRR